MVLFLIDQILEVSTYVFEVFKNVFIIDQILDVSTYVFEVLRTFLFKNNLIKIFFEFRSQNLNMACIKVKSSNFEKKGCM